MQTSARQPPTILRHTPATLRTPPLLGQSPYHCPPSSPPSQSPKRRHPWNSACSPPSATSFESFGILPSSPRPPPLEFLTTAPGVAAHRPYTVLRSRGLESRAPRCRSRCGWVPLPNHTCHPCTVLIHGDGVCCLLPFVNVYVMNV